MQPEIAALVFITSAVVLFKSSAWVIDSALRFSKAVGISTFTVGFLILSVSTSMPELGVAIFSSFGNAAELSMGNIFGSNLAVLTLILPLCVFFGGMIKLQRSEAFDLIELLVITLLALSLIFYLPGISSLHGLIFLAVFALVAYRLYKQGQIPKEFLAGNNKGTKTILAKLLVSIALLLIASRFLVDSALTLSSSLLLSTSVFGATAVAVSTTLPELSVELRAIRKGEYALAMGDLFGSAVTNLTLVLGTLIVLSPAKASPMPLAFVVLFTLLAMLVIGIALWRKAIIAKKEATVLFILYLLFLFQQLGLMQKIL